jgi:chemotaxis protein MotB
MFGSRRRATTTVDVWPGYVDALSALLMLVIFMVLIFTLAQVFLSLAVSSKDRQLEELNAQLDEISSALGLQRQENARLTGELGILRNQYQQEMFYQDALKEQIAELERTVATDKETLSLRLAELAQLQQDIVALSELRRELEANIALLASDLQQRDRSIEQLENEGAARLAEIGQLRDRSKALEARLAEQRDLTLLAQRELDDREIRIQDLVAIVNEGAEALADEKRLSASAQASVKKLSAQIDELKDKLSIISQALQLEERKSIRQQQELADLGQRLNTLLAERVNELERYRSEFFGRLRQVLIDNPDIRVVGDRFLLPSELFFASGSADLGDEGKRELDKLARTLNSISSRIPSEINWILRVDGHTDQLPIHTARFPSNWELSTARAVSVVRYLVERGVSPARMTAAGFGEFHPLDAEQSEAAFRRNRRIELKLTER